MTKNVGAYGRELLHEHMILIQTFSVLFIAIFIGLGTAKLSVEAGTGFGGITIGPWHAYPRIGTYNIDPYARAAIIRRMELPLGVGEGLSFTAQTDTSGLPLNGRCTYRMEGTLPPARAWTLTVHKMDGTYFSHSHHNYYITSGMVIFKPANALELNASPSAQPGNWLPLPDNAPFAMVFRFYDLSVTLSASAIERTPLPTIERLSCQ